jgi:Ni2+-binding GTPase involved in maturation of urease and hydrogenase
VRSLTAYVDFDIERAIGNIRVLNPDVETFVVSSKDKTGLTEWNSLAQPKGRGKSGVPRKLNRSVDVAQSQNRV